MRSDLRVWWLCPGFEYDHPTTGGLLYLRIFVDALKKRYGDEHVVALNLVADRENYGGIEHRLYVNWKYLVHLSRTKKDPRLLVMVDSRTYPLLLLPILYLRILRRMPIGMTAYHVHHSASTRSGLLRMLEKLSERLFLSCASFIVTISEATRRDLEQAILGSGTGNIPIHIVRPGVKTTVLDTPPVKDDDGTVLSALYVGNCDDPRKGLSYLLKAIAQLSDCTLRLTLVGGYRKDGAYYQQLRALMQEHDLHRVVSFAGRVSEPELDSLYRSADLFVLPSLWEGYGIVLAEAMGYGLPILATNVGAIPEIVEDGGNGILVPPRDPSYLADALRYLMERPTARIQMGRRSLELAKGFRDWEAVEVELLQIVARETNTDQHEAAC